MKDAVEALCKDNDLVPSLLEELTAPALPADGLAPGFLLLTLPPVGGCQGEQQHGEQDVDAYRPPGFLRGMLQIPRLLGFLDPAILDQTAVIIVVERLQGLVHRGIGQEDRFTRRAIRMPVPLTDNHGIEGVGLEVTPVMVAPMLWRPILVITCQPGDAHDLRFQPLSPRRFALAMAHRVRPAPDAHPFALGGLG